MDSILVPAPAIITLKENETFDWLILGTLSNHDDEPSGRRPEVLERTGQPLRMSTLSSTSRSGREIQCFDVVRSTWVLQTIFNHFLAPFILFYNTVWAKQTFVLLFFEGWTAGAIFFKESCPVFGWQRREGIVGPFAALPCYYDRWHRQIYVPVFISVRAEESLFSVRPGQRSFCWK